MRGYKFAADLLVQRAIQDRAESANLVFPALFNYRHFIELALKYIIQEFGARAGVSLGDMDHKLLSLWAKFIEIAKVFGDDETDETLNAVGSCISEFDAIDVKSTSFRYATDLGGRTPPLPRDGLDLIALHDVMNGLETYFDVVDTHYSMTIEAEMESEASLW